jgi:hypothetical protein
VVNLHRDGAASATTHIQANKDQHMIDESRRTQNPQSQSPDKDKAKVQTPVKASKNRPSE